MSPRDIWLQEFFTAVNAAGFTYRPPDIHWPGGEDEGFVWYGKDICSIGITFDEEEEDGIDIILCGDEDSDLFSGTFAVSFEDFEGHGKYTHEKAAMLWKWLVEPETRPAIKDDYCGVRHRRKKIHR